MESAALFLHHLHTDVLLFLLGWALAGDISVWMEKWREKERKGVSAPKMSFIKTCMQHTHQVLVPQTWTWSSSPRISVWKEDTRDTNLAFPCFYQVILICLPKLATGAVNQQQNTNFCGQGLSVQYLRDTGSLLETATSWLSPALLETQAPAPVSPLVLQFHTLLPLCLLHLWVTKFLPSTSNHFCRVAPGKKIF